MSTIMKCPACAESFKLPEGADAVICPHCQKRLRIKPRAAAAPAPAREPRPIPTPPPSIPAAPAPAPSTSPRNSVAGMATAAVLVLALAGVVVMQRAARREIDGLRRDLASMRAERDQERERSQRVFSRSADRRADGDGDGDGVAGGGNAGETPSVDMVLGGMAERIEKVEDALQEANARIEAAPIEWRAGLADQKNAVAQMDLDLKAMRKALAAAEKSAHEAQNRTQRLAEELGGIVKAVEAVKAAAASRAASVRVVTSADDDGDDDDEEGDRSGKKPRDRSAGRGKGKVVAIRDANFPGTIRKGVTLVDFWAPWCGPCRELAPTIEQVAKEIGSRALIAKINVDENKKYSREYNITGIPTLLIFKDGEMVERYSGPRNKESIAAAVRKWAK